MKRLMIFWFLTVGGVASGQTFEVTPNGLMSESDRSVDYLVIEVPDKSAEDLYKSAYQYIQEMYKNPDEVIKGNVEGSYLKYETFAREFMRYNNSGAKVPINALYTTELRFKDGKVRYQIIANEMLADGSPSRIVYSGGLLSGLIIYKKNGSLFKEDAKNDIENYFNSQVQILKDYLSGQSVASDDW